MVSFTRFERMSCCSSLGLASTPNNDPDFLKKIKPCDESWIYSYDPKPEVQSSQCKLPGHLIQRGYAQVGETLGPSWPFSLSYHEGVVHHEYTALSDNNQGVLNRNSLPAEGSSEEKMEAMWGDWHLHLNNASAHSCLVEDTQIHIAHRLPTTL